MTKPQLTQELQNILDVLKADPEGMKIGAIAAALPGTMPKRTLLRRLADLKAKEYITSVGQRNNTRYFIASRSEELLPLSKPSKLLKSQVRRPLQQRKPVAYIADFLYSYQPNKTHYLSKTTRNHLKDIGQQFNHDVEPGTYVKRILHRLLIDLSWNSSRLEGNTYSLLETEQLIEFGAVAEGKNAFEAQMIINHKEAIEFMVAQVDEPNLNPHTVLNIHALLANNLLANPKARGQLRQIPVGIAETVYHPPEIPQIISECFDYILTIINKITDPFEQAFFAMVQLPYLQSFEDVNKRVSRLVANIPLIKHNFSPLSFIDVPKDDYISGLLAIYELNKIELMRDVFIWAYERSAQQYQLVQNTLKEPDLIHMRLKNELFELVNLIITNEIRDKDIIQTIQKWAQAHIENTYQLAFMRLAEREIASLHEGNIAVYHIKPEVFAKWRTFNLKPK